MALVILFLAMRDIDIEKLIAATDSSSIYREHRVMLEIPKFTEGSPKWTGVPIFMGSPKFYDTGVIGLAASGQLNQTSWLNISSYVQLSITKKKKKKRL